jgi:hypothetical protein
MTDNTENITINTAPIPSTTTTTESIIKNVGSSSSSITPPISHLSTQINQIPYLIWIFKSTSSNSLFASFFSMFNGEVITKRLSRRWLNPPTTPEYYQQWYVENIGSILTRTRGPEDTPKRPPMRAPPTGGNINNTSDYFDSWISEGVSGIISNYRPQRKRQSSYDISGILNTSTSSSSQSPELVVTRLQKRIREQELEIQTLQSKLQTTITTSTTINILPEQEMKRMKQQGFDEAMNESEKTLRLMRQDLNDAHRRRIEIESLSEAKVREAECIIQECEDIMSSKNKEINQLKNTCDILNKSKDELEVKLKSTKDELDHTRKELITKQALVDELTTYVGELLARRS